jgi:hypothetical protein
MVVMEASPLDTRTRMSDVIHEVLHNGDAVEGWAGNKLLTMTHHAILGWELWEEVQTPEGTMWEEVAKQRVLNAPLNMTLLVRELAKRDTFGSRGVSHEDHIEAYLARVDQNVKDKEARLVDRTHDATANVMYTVAKAAGYKPKAFW